MLNGLMSALFVLAGGACAVAGYAIGSWHERRSMEAGLAGELLADHGFDLLDEVAPHRATRPN
jgi:hypothetical protein